MDLILEIIGVTGLVILLCAFILNTWRHTRSRVILYNSMQYLGALLLCIYAAQNKIALFVFLQAVWAIVALFFIYENLRERDAQKNKKKKK